jgi:uncharacterized protein
LRKRFAFVAGNDSASQVDRDLIGVRGHSGSALRRIDRARQFAQTASTRNDRAKIFLLLLSGSRAPDRPWTGPTSQEPLMPKMIFVNLPVSDLARSTSFYEAIGATKNPQFSDDTASCMVVSDTIYVMLLTHDKFRQFTPKKIADAKNTCEVLNCLSADSRNDVDDIIGKAGGAGGSADPSPKQDYGFMYGRSFEDPDGHIWEVMWMDVEAATKAHSASA